MAKQVDTDRKNSDNQGSFVIQGDGEQIKIHTKDLRWNYVGGHKHHYLPDFADETEDYVALKCAKPGCIHGALYKKEGKDFVQWLDERRATT